MALGRILPCLDTKDLGDLALKPIRELPDAQFFDAVTAFLRGVDHAYLIDRSLDAQRAVCVRDTLALRLRQSWGWPNLDRSLRTSIGHGIGSAIAGFFLNRCGLTEPLHCPFPFETIGPVKHLIPALERLVQGCRCLFVANATLNLIERCQAPVFLEFLVSATGSWLDAFSSDREFWVDQAIGSRFCRLLRAILAQEEGQQLLLSENLENEVAHILDELVLLGVPEASALEQDLTPILEGCSASGSQ